MKTETYKQAHKLQEEIAKLKYELQVLFEKYEKPTFIRFGTEYNVSIPIEFDLHLYCDVIDAQMTEHKNKIKALETEFNEL